ncbi:response regulator transcription factor [Paeniglutamicibacter cryotolerans]|uniref:DNA-binding NarL/FixJ family response regulator n=1 Tax=Paeniglutamicibacter cryotolerans TaxID=670079 RepID=A0A839QPP6_9MICC|nr:response regulator transcription factor [Paeniglutamicibacter cryotolerans]MBB2995212.1 DNA-binding NarL/FixJ family response regulator [Paeniglutamicibacter cryotolerans]
MSSLAQNTCIKTRVFIIDDHATFAELLSGALDREPDLLSLGSAGTIASGIEQCLILDPDVVIMDHQLPDGSGISAATKILADAPHARIIILTGHPTPQGLVQAASFGASAFLAKGGSLAVVLDALRYARPGGMIVPPALIAQYAQPESLNATGLSLTPRELEILSLMAEGHDVRANSRRLGISVNTCRGHVKSILAKLGSHSQLEAVAAATKLGVFGPADNA